jgi:UDPglucose--hexose-1-phosphate uridylyltransferase
VSSIADLDEAERGDLAAALLRVAGAYDRHFGFSTPYVMAMHQAPTDGRAWPEAHLHIEFYPPHRRADRLKHLAGVELGAGTFVNDTKPEDTASQLRRAARKRPDSKPAGGVRRELAPPGPPHQTGALPPAERQPDPPKP